MKNVCQDLSPDLTPVQTHKPYDLNTETGASNHLVPGTRIEDGRYPVVTGLEHDEMGHPSSSPDLHEAMTRKRRNKLKALSDKLPIPEVYGAQSGEVLVVGWGSTTGPLYEAVEKSGNNGQAISALKLRHINPLPNGLEDIFARFKKIYVVEMNDGGVHGYGQLAGLLRARFADPRIQGINKTDALRWKVREILDRINERREIESK